jgi:hypothetical protein
MRRNRALTEFCAKCGGACEFTSSGNRRSSATVQRANDAMTLTRGIEFDIHVWAKPASELRSGLYTVSVGRQALCIDMPVRGLRSYPPAIR